MVRMTQMWRKWSWKWLFFSCVFAGPFWADYYQKCEYAGEVKVSWCYGHIQVGLSHEYESHMLSALVDNCGKENVISLHFQNVTLTLGPKLWSHRTTLNFGTVCFRTVHEVSTVKNSPLNLGLFHFWDFFTVLYICAAAHIYNTEQKSKMDETAGFRWSRLNLQQGVISMLHVMVKVCSQRFATSDFDRWIPILPRCYFSCMSNPQNLLQKFDHLPLRYLMSASQQVWQTTMNFVGQLSEPL